MFVLIQTFLYPGDELHEMFHLANRVFITQVGTSVAS
jgi:hypothetical protein